MATVRFTGQFNRLGNLAEAVERLGKHAYKDALARSEAAVAQQVEKQYGAGRGPYGEQWAPKAGNAPKAGRRAKMGGRSFLQRTGAMKSATRTVAGVKGITVSAPKPAGFHQGGTKFMPARRLVPSGSALSTPWRAAVMAACREAVGLK